MLRAWTTRSMNERVEGGSRCRIGFQSKLNREECCERRHRLCEAIDHGARRPLERQVLPASRVVQIIQLPLQLRDLTRQFLPTHLQCILLDVHLPLDLAPLFAHLFESLVHVLQLPDRLLALFIKPVDLDKVEHHA